MNETTFRKITQMDAHPLAILHLQSLQDGLLYDLGQKYTELFYKIGIGSDNCFGYVATKDEQIIGAAISTKNIDLLFRKLLLTPSFSWGLFKKLFRLRKLYPSGGTKIPLKQEFILFFIDKKNRDLRTALQLMKLIDKEYACQGYKKYSLEVKENNTAANLLYQRFGFVKTHEVGTGENKRLFYEKVTGGT